MKMKAFVNSIIISCLVLVALPMAPVQVEAQELTHTFVGLSPSSITETDLLRDRAIEKTVNLQRDLGTRPLTLEVDFTGDAGRFLRGPEEVFFEIGQLQTTYTFEIFPEAAATDEYSAQVSFLPKESGDEVEGTGFGIRRGVALKVDFTVTDSEVLEYEVSHSELRQTEVGLPFYFSYTVDNTGNVEWRPDRIEFFFEETFGAVHSDKYTVDGALLEPAKPGNFSMIQLDVDHTLPIGHYDATIDFYSGEEMVQSMPGSIIVFETGTLDQSAELLNLETNKTSFAANENIKLTARMKNNGDITTVGVLVTEIYSTDGTLIDILTSEPRSAAPGQEVDIDQIVKLQDAGDYRIESSIEFAGTKTTESMEVMVQIEDTFLTSGIDVLPFILLGLAFLVMLFVIFLIFRSIHRHNEKELPIIKSVEGSQTQTQTQSLQPMASTIPTQPAPAAQAIVPAAETRTETVQAPAQQPPLTSVTPEVQVQQPMMATNSSTNLQETDMTVSNAQEKTEEAMEPSPQMEVPQSSKKVIEPQVQKETPQPVVKNDDDDEEMWTISL